MSHTAQHRPPARAAGPTTGAPPPSGTPVPHPEGVSEDEFRAAMARLAAGVVLVTAQEASDEDDEPPPTPGTGAHLCPGEPAGMTATSFLSVSLRPPLVLVSVRTGSRMDEVLAEQPLWAASLLADDQRTVAGQFAMKGRLSDRLLFRHLPHTHGAATGAPLVEGALGAVECRTEERVPAGDHHLVVGRVLATHPASGRRREPLAYYNGRYRTLG
ncbi:flavin reductase family protein [Streptomyces sp. NPDC005438]|uniref:flavin reductase family protein n=1 Tax=Streptomyces sp. NPDC005438 TaxID=3156880 RepID=UPI0033B1AC1F